MKIRLLRVVGVPSILAVLVAVSSSCGTTTPQSEPAAGAQPPKKEAPAPVQPPKREAVVPVQPPKKEAPAPVQPAKTEAPAPAQPPKKEAAAPAQPPSATADINALQGQKKQLEAEKAKLGDAQKDVEKRADQSDALVALKKAADEAGKAYEEKKKSGGADVAKRQQAMKDAQAEFEKVVAAKTTAAGGAATSEIKKFDQQIADLRSKLQQAEAKVQQERAKSQGEVEADPEVKKAAEALHAAQVDLQANPARSVVDAGKVADEARKALAALDDGIRQTAEVAKAAEAEAKAHAALQEAIKEDPKRLAAEKAKQVYLDGRTGAFAGMGAAKPLLVELDTVNKQLQDVGNLRAGANHMVNVHRKAIRDGQDKEIVAARAALDKAKSAFDAAVAGNAELARLKEQVTAAGKEFGQKHDEMFGKNADYVALQAKAKEQQAKLDKMDQDILKASGSDAVKKLAVDIQNMRSQVSTANMQAREIRMSVGKDVWDKIYNAGGVAERALIEKVNTVPAAVAARAAMVQAEKQVKDLVEKKLADSKEAAPLLKETEAIDKQSKELGQHRAAVNDKLYGSTSEINATVESDKKVADLRQASQAAEKDLRENPTKKVADAQAAYDKARADHMALVQKQRDAEKYKKAVTALHEAEAALGKARQDDPNLKTVAASSKAYADMKQAKTEQLKPVAALKAESQKLIDDIGKVEAEKRKASEGIPALAKTVREGNDAEIVAARKKLADAQQAVKTVEQSDEVKVLQGKSEKARSDYEAKRKATIAEDKDLKSAQARLQEIDKLIRDIDGKIQTAGQK